MKALVLNGSPRKTGFSAAAAAIARDHLASRQVEVDLVALADLAIRDCVGCFQCLRTGRCSLDDDMDALVARMRQADAFVVVSAVRNGDVSACYKRFYERITYRLGFPLALEDRHTLAISVVGYMGGKAASRRFAGLQDVFHTRLSGHLHFASGIPGGPPGPRETTRITTALDRLVQDVHTRRGRGLADRASFAVDRLIMRRFVFRGREDVYADVVRQWREKGYMD